MAKVHPNNTLPAEAPPATPEHAGEAAVLTVWRKSLLFNCSGFTVFDAEGNLVFRVDNYVSGHRREVVLMDAAGKPLLTIRRKRLSLGERWLVYQGEETANPRFSVRKRLGLLQQGSALARVAPCAAAPAGARQRVLEVEGCYARRCCAVYDERRRLLAEIRRKEAVGGVGFGGDVFRLVVEPGFEASVAMAVVILLDQMFESGR